MAKKRKATRRKTKSTKKVQKHTLPAGFWAQVGAILFLALAVLYIVAWFGSGGPILEWLHQTTLNLVGYADYILPILFVFLAIEIFRSENNKLPLLTRFTCIFLIAWFAGLFGLMQDSQGQPTGGLLGEGLNIGMLSMVNTAVAGFVYVILIIITTLIALRLSPIVVIRTIWSWMQNNLSEEERSNAEVMKKANAKTKEGQGIKLKFGGSKTKDDKKKPVDEAINLNVSMPRQDNVDDKKSPKMSSFRGSTPPDKQSEDQQALVAVRDPNWQGPDLDLLEKKEKQPNPGDVQANARLIKDTLSEFNIDADMEDANVGPKVTQYTLKPSSGVKLARITALENNIALNLAAQSLRIEAPIPGKSAVGIEVPNEKAADVRLYGVLTSNQWKANRQPLSFAVGRDISGEAVVGDLNKMPHLLIAGQTGSGKSVMINTLLTSMLYRNSPSEMKLILIDPKTVEMKPYYDIPHLLTPVITDPEKAMSALKWAVNEMERRLKLIAEEDVREIDGYNKKIRSRATKISVEDEDGNMQQHDEGTMPYIVIVIDEMSDLMMAAARDMEALIVRITQKARAAGIHMVLATQRPSVNVITGLIKANVPARIAFTVASQVDSRTILDSAGADKLLGQGDMLMKTAQMGKPIRVQGAWVTDEEVVKINNFLRMQSAPQYNEEIVSQPVNINGKGGVVMDFDGDSNDSMYNDALRVVIESRKASASLLQRRLRIGYARAARIIEEMEDQGVIGPADGARPRDVLISSSEELSGSSE